MLKLIGPYKEVYSN